MHNKLVHDEGGAYSQSAYQRAEEAHRHALRLMEVAGLATIDGSDEEYVGELKRFGEAEGNERQLRIIVAEIPISSVEDAKNKATYFKYLFDSEWIDINQEDIKAVLTSIETMDC